ncbi:U11/U12 small nuclear ribonucleoprotein 65 kDa protein, partial [Bienertia sinuspersici]
DAFLKERVAKAQEKLLRLQRRNREIEMESIITDIMTGKMKPEDVKHTDLGDLLWVLDDKLQGVEHRLSVVNALPPMVTNENGDGAAPKLWRNEFEFPPQSYPDYPQQQQPNLSHQEPIYGSNSSQLSSPSTLLIRHLPEAIPFDTLSRLFSHYAPFLFALVLLQVAILGKVLSVEKSSKPSEDDKYVKGESEKNILKSLNKDNSQSRDKHDGSESANAHGAEPIAEKLGVNYPFPPHLEYAYPPPDGNILTIFLTLYSRTSLLYTGVALDEQNEHSSSISYGTADSSFTICTSSNTTTVASVTEKPPPENLSSDESEMESSDEEVDDEGEAPNKRIKRELIVGPGIDKDVSHEAVGLKPATLVPKEIPIIKKKNSVLQIKIAPKKVQCEVNDDNMVKEPEKLESADVVPYATTEQIESQKLPPEEILSLPMFKVYSVDVQFWMNYEHTSNIVGA